MPLSEDLAFFGATGEEMLDPDRLLDELAAVDARKARLFELKVFPGCSTVEAAKLPGISKPTADRDFRLTRAWIAEKPGAENQKTRLGR